MTDQIERILQHTRQYWYVDGITELAFGGFCLLLGAYFGVQSYLPRESALSQVMNLVFIVFVIVSALLMRKVVNFLKQSITYPRTGYVAYPRPQHNRRLLNAVVALGMGVVISALFASAPESMAWIPAVSGLLIGAAWLFFAFRVGLGRFYALAMFSALTGAAISLGGLGENPGLAIFYGVFGVAMLVSGGLTLLVYLRKTRPASADELETLQ